MSCVSSIDDIVFQDSRPTVGPANGLLPPFPPGIEAVGLASISHWGKFRMAARFLNLASTRAHPILLPAISSRKARSVRKRPRSRTSRRASFVHVRGRASDERRTPAGAAKGDGGLARRTGGSCRARVPRRLPDGRGTVLTRIYEAKRELALRRSTLVWLARSHPPQRLLPEPIAS